MKIRLLSDIHHEFYEDQRLYSNKGEDVLVVAGDLNVGHDRCWSALKQFAEHTEHVVYVPGNHEYYHQSMVQFDDYMRRFSTSTNIHFLNPGSTKIGDVAFIGACLWTNFGDDRFNQIVCAQRINDFRIIKGFSGDICTQLYNEHIAYIKHQYEAVKGKKVIVTHFLPDRACIAPQYRGPDVINHYFANNLGDWISDLTDTTWLFGHTHDNVDIVIGDTRVIANPYGYNRNEHYVEKLIEV
jgi:Icc-related predicted phosphoesterase